VGGRPLRDSPPRSAPGSARQQSSPPFSAGEGGAGEGGARPGGARPGGARPGGARPGSDAPVSDIPARAGPGSDAAAGAPRVAAIDCGTNSLRLLVADVDPRQGTLADLVRRMEIVRLGQGVDATGRLAPDALARTFRVLEEYAAIITDCTVGAVRMVATSATRDAANSSEFVRGVTRILGKPPEVLSGGQEAFLSFTGATAELASRGQGNERFAPPYLVVDIGGGSTEFVLGSGQAAGPAPDGTEPGAEQALPIAASSVDIGCVRLTERYLHSDPPAEAEITLAIADIDAAISLAVAHVPAQRARTLVGLAGSVTTVAGIALDLPAYDATRIHHARIPADQVHAVTRMLLGQTRAQRSQIGVMHPGRVDVIGAGALVLDRMLTRLGFAEVVVSEHDILDGIARSMVDRRAG
jgi:exopolyphosphatase / guanosine-5'-triphosphate,3'-diphosphate pyrophosphatase